MEECSVKCVDRFVTLFLLQHYYFYATGHETTFTNIKWESAFHGMYGDTSTTISHLALGSLIVSNTFCSTIIVILYVIYFTHNNKDLGNTSKLKVVLKFSLLNSIKVILLFIIITFEF
jgi:hypothetical protein